MYRFVFLFLLTLLIIPGTGVVWASEKQAPPTVAPWSRSVDSSFKLHQVTPLFYRSALPTPDDIPVLQRYGIQTVISLIKEDDREWLGKTPMNIVSYPVHADRVNDEDVLHVLGTLEEAQKKGPVLLHCKHGSNRTGLFTAMYRTVVEGWSKEDAIDEMVHGGFSDDPKDTSDAVAYVKNADVGKLRNALNQGQCSTSSIALCQLEAWFGQLLTPAGMDG